MHAGSFLNATLLQRGAKSPLHTALAHRLGGCRHTLPRWKKPYPVTVGDPVGSQHLKRTLWQWDISIFRPFTQSNVQELAGTVDIRHLQLDTFLQAQATGVNGAQTDPVVRPSQATQNAAHFLAAENDWQLVLTRRSDKAQRRPCSL